MKDRSNKKARTQQHTTYASGRSHRHRDDRHRDERRRPATGSYANVTRKSDRAANKGRLLQQFVNVGYSDSEASQIYSTAQKYQFQDNDIKNFTRRDWKAAFDQVKMVGGEEFNIELCIRCIVRTQGNSEIALGETTVTSMATSMYFEHVEDVNRKRDEQRNARPRTSSNRSPRRPDSTGGRASSSRSRHQDTLSPTHQSSPHRSSRHSPDHSPSQNSARHAQPHSTHQSTQRPKDVNLAGLFGTRKRPSCHGLMRREADEYLGRSGAALLIRNVTL